MSKIVELKEISDAKKIKIYELEKQNVENILKNIKEENCVRRSKKNDLATKLYKGENCIVYKLEKEDELDFPTILTSAKELKGLSWGELTNIREEKEWESNVKEGIWITNYKDEIRYTISLDKELILAIQVSKKENGVEIKYLAKTQEIEKQLQENIKDKMLIIDILKGINYENEKIGYLLEQLDINCISLSRSEIEKQLLIEEKQELEKNIEKLTEQINRITIKVDEMSKQAISAEKETKKTIEEINKVTKENENLKNSIMNVRKIIAKKCAYLPIIGKILIKELNKEFGEKALPSG